jgi:hypothetical protein
VATCRERTGGFGLGAAVGLLTLSFAAGCGGNQLKTSGEAAGYIDDLIRGSDEAVELADDASRVAVVAVEDAPEVNSLGQTIEQAPDKACDVVGLVSTVADAAPENPEPMQLTPDAQGFVRLKAFGAGVPETTTESILSDALAMAQSTWVDAADSACDVASS